MATTRSAGRALVEALDAYLTDAALLFFHLRAAGQELAQEGQASTGRRSILKDLAERGPQTVPALARTRALSRQYIQRLVNELLDDGFVVYRQNPRHRRSQLVALTDAGRTRVVANRSMEEPLLRTLAAGLNAEEVRVATTVARTLRDRLASREFQRALRARRDVARG